MLQGKTGPQKDSEPGKSPTNPLSHRKSHDTWGTVPWDVMDSEVQE